MKKAVFGIGTALGATATFLGLGKKAEAEAKDSERAINKASEEGDRKIEGVKSETSKMATPPPPRPDAEAVQDKRTAKAEGEAAGRKVDAMEAGLRAMDKLSSHAAEIIKRYGSHASKGMVAGMNVREPHVSASASANVLMQEQIRLLYEQKSNHKMGVFNVLSMIGANNELLGVLSDQLKLIHVQGITDANYDVMKAKVLERMADRAIADSVKSNAIIDQHNEALQLSLQELIALQKEGNESQNAGTRPLLKKVGLGMVAGLAGLAGLVMASKYLGKGDDQEQKEDKDKEPEWKWPWDDDEDVRNDEEDRKNSDYIRDDGSLMSVEERNRVDEIKNEAKLTGGAAATATAIEGINAIKRGRAAATATKATAEAAGKAGGKALTAEARKKFLKNLGPRALKVIGTKIATKLGIKAATKGALKKIPVAGLLFSLFEAVPRIAKGDYTGASLAIGSGAASLLHAADVVTGPGGSIAAISLGLAADGALALHDYNKAMEDLKTKGYSDLLDDDDLADVFVTPTEEEMKAAEEADKKVKSEQDAKPSLDEEDGSSSGSWGKVSDIAATASGSAPGALPSPSEGNPGSDRKKSLDDMAKAMGRIANNISQPGGEASDSTSQKGEGGSRGLRKVIGDIFSKAGDTVPPSLSSGNTVGGLTAHEVSHDPKGTWMGYGAKDEDGEGVGDLSECRSYPPETMDRITNFEAYPPNEIDESGTFNGDVQGMINDLVGMQGTIKYSMEQRDIDKGIGDCSTFTKWAMKKYFGIDIGNNCDMQLGENYGKVVDYSGVGINGEKAGARGPNMSVLKPGDLIYYSSDRRPWNAGRPFRISHVEMYIGDGKVIGQTTVKGKGKGSSPNGPWVHDINDPVLGTFLAAKRYIGQTPETAKYAADPQSVSAQQAPAPAASHDAEPAKVKPSTMRTMGSLKRALTAVNMTASGKAVPSPTHAVAGKSAPGLEKSISVAQEGAPGNGGASPTMVDNSTVTRGGDTYITNNTTNNIYTHEDGRGDSEVL